MSERALVPVEQRTVSFYQDEIMAVLVEVAGEQRIYVPIRPIVEKLGLDWGSQRKRLTRDSVLSAEAIPCVVIMTTQGQPDQRREVLCLPLDYLNGFLFGISAERVRPELRDQVIRYQRECYRVLAEAFLERRMETAVTPSPTIAALEQVRQMGLAIAEMAAQQILFEERMGTAEARLDNAALVVRAINRRLTEIEHRVAPGNPITEEQAGEIQQKVRAMAMQLSEKDRSKNHFQSIFSELARRFRVAGYHNIPQAQYANVLAFLDEWWITISGKSD